MRPFSFLPPFGLLMQIGVGADSVMMTQESRLHQENKDRKESNVKREL